ncbi:hypothetical protein [Kibdelosporangium persicum]|nr:hypothetical protein [Kibdelosporangium persicum]
MTIDQKDLPQPRSDADRCRQNQFLALVAADEEAGRLYRARLFKELLEQAAAKGASSVADQPPDLARLISDVALTPMEIAQAMSQAAADTSTTVRIESCEGQAKAAQSGDTVLASQEQQLDPPKPPPVVDQRTPSKLIDYLRALVDYLKRNVSEEFRQAVTVGFSITLSSQGGATKFRVAFAANTQKYLDEWFKNNPVLASVRNIEQDGRKLLNQEIQSVVDALRKIGITTSLRGGLHAEEQLVNAEARNTGVDMIFIGATNNICAGKCQASIRNSPHKVIPATRLGDVPNETAVDFWGDPIVVESGVDMWSLANLRNKINAADLPAQRVIINNINDIIKANADPETLWKALRSYNRTL